MGHNSRMQSQRFLPEVRRNRVVSNWVAASRIQQPSLVLGRSRFWLIPALVAPLIAAACLAISPQVSPSGLTVAASGANRAASSPTPSAKPFRQASATNSCSATEIAANFGSLPKITIVTLGGVRSSTVQCGLRNGISIVSEALVRGQWQIKKISRPPEGDQEISFEY